MLSERYLLNTILKTQNVTNIWRETEENLTAIGGHFFGTLFNKEKAFVQVSSIYSDLTLRNW